MKLLGGNMKYEEKIMKLFEEIKNAPEIKERLPHDLNDDMIKSLIADIISYVITTGENICDIIDEVKKSINGDGEKVVVFDYTDTGILM